MLAFLKRWRQAYLEDKSNRLHAEAEAERNALCAEGMSFDEAVCSLNKKSSDELSDWLKAFTKAHEECTEYEEDEEFYRSS
ncbi:hypothetical protein BS333_21330 (plasmid) [Vibrio azureus]|uniref:Uncharacterized protein n=1 Tax=Vibrio azureus NBRC 104587 TaxID=1219077 RepID=U3A8B7_9VIBR|nr:hypothetical protein [Vibrio azureus]AUI88925.1 hypothetical protein BS333_21330 [Vibrio azureus]GAD76191.1 hypothetical protein VAZ01S_039_00160 [Vibrio azureus NBRC 104587]